MAILRRVAWCKEVGQFSHILCRQEAVQLWNVVAKLGCSIVLEWNSVGLYIKKINQFIMFSVRESLWLRLVTVLKKTADIVKSGTCIYWNQWLLESNFYFCLKIRVFIIVSNNVFFWWSFLIWSDAAASNERISELKPYQHINHFPGMAEICRKDSLARNMARYWILSINLFFFSTGSLMFG